MESRFRKKRHLIPKFKIFSNFQFNSQEPGTNQEIKKFINEKFNFFPDLYAKIDVNGKNAHPLWEFLKHEQHGFFNF